MIERETVILNTAEECSENGLNDILCFDAASQSFADSFICQANESFAVLLKDRFKRSFVATLALLGKRLIARFTRSHGRVSFLHAEAYPEAS
jgi:hypothetical protein